RAEPAERPAHLRAAARNQRRPPTLLSRYGACEQLLLEKASTGCNSIALGATPRWPWSKSKKPTPAIVAMPERVTTNPAGGRPQARTKLARALAIIRLAALGADDATQAGAGNSAIIVPADAGSAI